MAPSWMISRDGIGGVSLSSAHASYPREEEGHTEGKWRGAGGTVNDACTTQTPDTWVTYGGSVSMRPARSLPSSSLREGRGRGQGYQHGSTQVHDRQSSASPVHSAHHAHGDTCTRVPCPFRDTHTRHVCCCVTAAGMPASGSPALCACRCVNVPSYGGRCSPTTISPLSTGSAMGEDTRRVSLEEDLGVVELMGEQFLELQKQVRKKERNGEFVRVRMRVCGA